MLSGAIFDFDGVIVDSHHAHKRAWKKFLESVGKMATEDELQFVLDGRKRDDIVRHFLGELDPARLAEYGLRKDLFFREEAASMETVSGLREFLRELENSRLPLAVASSGSASRVNFLLDRLDLRKHFRVVVTGDEVEQGKPHPGIFLRAAQYLRLHPAELIVFEDAVSGVKAARSAGMICVGLAQPEGASLLRDAGADHVVPNFTSLSFSKLQELAAQ